MTQAASEKPGVGLSRVELPDGDVVVLSELVKSESEALFGEAHLAEFGANPVLLVKILDPAERLPVHAHPSRSFAAQIWGSAAGKAEAWIVTSVREEVTDPCVYLGLRDDVAPDDFVAWMAEQDAQRLVSALHRVPVQVGDVVYVPPGMPHAIGAGVMVMEAQEPTDYSYLCEFEGYQIDAEAAQLGLEISLGRELLDLEPRSLAEIREQCFVVRDGDRLLHGACEEFFSARHAADDAEQAGGRFCVAVATAEGWIEAGGARYHVASGEGFVVPASLDSWRYTGGASGVAFYGPSPARNR